MSISIEDIKKVIEDIKDFGGTEENLHDVFPKWFIVKILNYGEEILDECYIGKSRDLKVDIGIIDDTFEKAIILQFKFPTRIIEQIQNLEELRRHRYGRSVIEEILIGEKYLKEEIPSEIRIPKDYREFREEVQTKEYPIEKIIVVFGYLTDDALKFAREYNVEVYDIERIINEYLIKEAVTQKNPPRKLEFELEQNINCIGVSLDGYETYICPLKVYYLYKWIKDYERKPDISIFNKNIRYKLKGKKHNKIRERIFNTLENNPEQFLILNNGITIVCRDLKVDKENRKVILENPQIVNGCQTSFAIFDFFSKKKMRENEIKRIPSYVLAKIIKAPPQEEIIDKITEASNLQNPISWRDLRSNDKWQRKIQIAFENRGIFYERKAGEWELLSRPQRDNFKVAPRKFRRLDNWLVGQIYLSLLGRPDFAKNNKKDIFERDDVYRLIFDYDTHNNFEFEGVQELRCGLNAFVDDVIFGYAIYTVGNATGHIYQEKERNYVDDSIKNTFNKQRFVRYWNLHLPYAFYIATEHIARRFGINSSDLRRKIIGDNIDIYFYSPREVARKFKINENRQSWLLLDEHQPAQGELNLLGKWLISMQEIFYDVFRHHFRNADPFKVFFKKNTLEFLKCLREEIIDRIGGRERDVREKFPF